jgi:hypothetical protein
VTRSADLWIKCTTIGCERAQEALLQLVQTHLAAPPVQRRVKQTQQGYLGKHIGLMLGERPTGSVTAEVLDAFYAGLRRCRDHCDGQPQCQQPDPPGTPHAEAAQAESAAKRDLLTLELVLDATRRAGGDWSRSGESERNVRLAGSAETRATVVVAAA